MANVYVQGVNGGETTTPTGEEGIELDDGSTSTWIKIKNLIGRKLRETSGPTTLSMGAIADGEFLKRSGSDIISAAIVASSDMLSTLVNTEVSVTTTATLTVGKMHVCSGTSADYTVTLPAASGNAGKFVGLRGATGLTKKVTIDGNASELIDGVSNIQLKTGMAITLMCDGTNWFTVSTSSHVRAWVKITISAGTPSIAGSYNVSSITDNGVGDYTINFASAFLNTNYACIGASSDGVIDGTNINMSPTNATYTTSACRVGVSASGSGANDAAVTSIVFLGD